MEKNALGLYLTGHPIDSYKAELMDILGGETLAETLQRVSENSGTNNQANKFARRGKRVWVAGLVMDIRVRSLKSGNGKMAFVTIDDRSARTEVNFFAKSYAQNQEHLKVDDILIIKGRAVYDDFSGSMKINAEQVFPLSKATTYFADAIQITVDDKTALEPILTTLRQHTSDKPSTGADVYFHVNGKHIEGKIRLPATQRLAMDTDCYQTLLKHCGESCVTVRYNLSKWQPETESETDPTDEGLQNKKSIQYLHK